jgi:hypothetical protein
MTSKAGVILLDDSGGTPRNISKDCITYTVEYKVNPEDVTGFTEGSQNFTPGLLVTGVTIEMFWNTLATTGAATVVNSVMTAEQVAGFTGLTLDVTPEGTGLSWAGEVMCDGYTITGSAQGSPIGMGSVHFSVMGATAPTIA